MHRLRRLVVVAGVFAVTAVVPALGSGAAPVIRDHVNFTSDPELGDICGIDATFVDTVVETYKEAADGSSMDNLMVTTLITAVDSGKSITFKSAGLQSEARPSPTVMARLRSPRPSTACRRRSGSSGGQPIAVDTGNISFSATVDANGEFVSFSVLNIKGPGLPVAATRSSRR